LHKGLYSRPTSGSARPAGHYVGIPVPVFRPPKASASRTRVYAFPRVSTNACVYCICALSTCNCARAYSLSSVKRPISLQYMYMYIWYYVPLYSCLSARHTHEARAITPKLNSYQQYFPITMHHVRSRVRPTQTRLSEAALRRSYTNRAPCR